MCVRQLRCLVDSVIVVRHPQLATDSEVKRCAYSCSKWPIGFLRNCDTVPQVAEHCEPGNAMAVYSFSL